MDDLRTLLRSRLALAATVTLACLGGGFGIALLSSSGPPSASAAATAPAHGHSRQAGVPGMSERELRAFETATLGPEHARQHAEMRRELRLRPEKPRPEPAERVQRAATIAAASGGHTRRDRELELRPCGHLPDRRDPCRAAAHREGDGLLLPAGTRVEELGRGLAVGPGHRGPHPEGPAALARSEGRCAQAGQHLVRRPDLHRRRGARGVRRQPRLRERTHRLEGPQQGLHVRSLRERRRGGVARAAGHGARALVPDRSAHGRWPHPDHERSRRDRHQQDGRGRGGLHPGPSARRHGVDQPDR